MVEISYGIEGIRYFPKWYAKYNGRTMFVGRCIGRNRAMRKALKHAQLLNNFHKVVV